MITKSLSCNEIWTNRSQESNVQSKLSCFDPEASASKRNKSSDKLVADNNESHKTVIYFGDSISNKKHQNKLNRLNNSASAVVVDEKFDLKHANRLCDEMIFQHQKPGNKDYSANNSQRSEKSTLLVSASMQNEQKATENDFQKKSETKNAKKSEFRHTNETKIDENLPSFIESVVNGVINIKIDSSYNMASKLLHSIENGKNYDKNESNYNDLFLDVGGEMNNAYLDWSFVQDWRAR